MFFHHFHFFQPRKQMVLGTLKQFQVVATQANRIAAIAIDQLRQEKENFVIQDCIQSTELPQPHQDGDGHFDGK